MKKLLVIMTTIVGAALFLPPAFAGTSGADVLAQGMMGGMMGGGMMGRSSRDDQAAPASVNPGRADELLAYIRSNKLPCTQCHSISGNGFGPSFSTVLANYENRDDASAILKDHIENGFGRMPAGLANDAESTKLARMIMDLAKSR